MGMGFALLSDFDGTIATVDTGEAALRKFGQGDWEALDTEYSRGRITFEECIQAQFSMIKAREEFIIYELNKIVQLRTGFRETVTYCQSKAIPFVIVSGGLDFIIRHTLKQEGLLDNVEIFGPRASWTQNGLKLVFPHRFYKDSVTFKDDLVRHHKLQGTRVFFVGNGLGDLTAAAASDMAFAVKGSRLAELCRKKRVPFREMSDFHDVIAALKMAGND